jgi:hypothetical protein
MTQLSDLEQTIQAYFLAGPANDINIAGRWYPYNEVLLIVDDKFQMAVRKFGPKARGATKPVAKAFVDHMIEMGGWTSKDNDFGGTMQQWQMDPFRAELKALQAANPLVQEATAGGETYWQEKFAALTA